MTLERTVELQLELLERRARQLEDLLAEAHRLKHCRKSRELVFDAEKLVGELRDGVRHVARELQMEEVLR